MSAEIRVTAKPADIEVTGAAPLRLDIGAVVAGGGGGASVPDWWRGSRYLNLLVSVPQDYDILGTPTLLPEGFVAYYVARVTNVFTSGSVPGLYAGHSDGVTPELPTFLGTPEPGDWFLYRVSVDDDGNGTPIYTFGEYLLYVPTLGGGPESPVSIGLGNVAGETSVDTTNFTGNLAGLDPANVQEALAVFDAYAGGGGGAWNFTGAYSGGAAYAVGDVATYNGETWYRLDAHGGNVGDTPVEGTYWTKVAAKGDTGVVAGTAPIVYTSATQTVSITAASTSAAGSMSSADKTKLDGIASGATANSSDATLLARANHTGTQAATTITGLAAIATSGSASDLTTGTVPSARLALTSTDIPNLDASKITTGTVATARLASGTASSSVFLRGDQTWASTPSGLSATVVAAGRIVDTTGSSTYVGSLLVPLNSNSASTYAVPLGAQLFARAFHTGQTIVQIWVVISATSLTAGQGVTIGCYNESAGLPTTLAWSQTITTGTGTGGQYAANLSKVMPTGPCWISVLNPSGNSGTVTLRGGTSHGFLGTVANDNISQTLTLDSQSSMSSDVSAKQLRTSNAAGELYTGGTALFPKVLVHTA